MTGITVDPNTGLSIGTCIGLGWVTVELNGYGNDRSYPDVIREAQQFIERAFPWKKWRRVMTQTDAIIFECEGDKETGCEQL